ncbi:LexA family protein [Alkanindiges hydrocarboniclasticus]|nr:translesion error-prone DNA polymerase V autoproteolytic subunit [Alkanindiges hydrocarboniclasticus]
MTEPTLEQGTTKRIAIYFSDPAFTKLEQLMGTNGKPSPTINQLLVNLDKFLSTTDFSPIYPSTRIAIPLALETIPAGFPSPAQDYVEELCDMNQILVPNAEASFLSRIRTLSMLGAGLDMDDLIIIDRSVEAKHNDIIVAVINSKDLTIKRLMQTAKMSKQEIQEILDNEPKLETLPSVWLKAENPEYDHIFPKPEETIAVWGVVRWNLKKLYQQK